MALEILNAFTAACGVVAAMSSLLLVIRKGRDE